MALLQASAFHHLLRCSRPMSTIHVRYGCRYFHFLTCQFTQPVYKVLKPTLFHATARISHVTIGRCHPIKVSRKVILVQARLMQTDGYFKLQERRNGYAEFKKDNVPAGFEFAYASPNMNTFLYLVPVFLFSLLAISVAILIAVLQKETRKHFTYTTCFCCMFPVVMTILYMKFFKTCPIRMYYNKSTNEFYAFVKKHGVKKHYLQFHPSEVKHLRENLGGTVSIHGHSMWITENGFMKPEIYNLFMGYSVSRSLDRNQASELFEKRFKERRERAKRKVINSMKK